MSYTDLYALLPLIVLAATPVLLIVVIAFRRDHVVTARLAAAGLIASLVLVPLTASPARTEITALLTLDNYARFFIGLIIAAALAVAFLSYDFLDGSDDEPDEFYVLLTLGTLGASVLAASSHFVSFFLGLEILSVSLYALIAYPRRSPNQIEAGLKYLILAGATSAFLLFGLALVYAVTGTMDFAAAAAKRPSDWLAPVVLFAGWGAVLVGIGFKLAVVPFHLWTPDVYQGAPAPVTAFVATVSKGAMFALLARLFIPSGAQHEMPLVLVFSLIALASMFAGNVLALLQENVKRIFAYSSIAHLGYLLVAFLASGERALIAVGFYLTAYFITTLAAFGVITVLSSADREADRISDYRGLFWRRPALAAIMTASLLSLAGVPLTAGFIGKFYIVLAGVGSTMWALVLALVVSSSIGLYFYLRVMVTMYMQPEETAVPVKARPLSYTEGAALAVAALLLVWLGIYPGGFLEMLESLLRF
jgi:NADH-quinone oxidoreductase subunit N